MAFRASEFLSVARFKQAIRLVGEDEAVDAQIADYLQAAAEWVEERVELGIVDSRAFLHGLTPPSGDLILEHRSLAIYNVQYWPEYEPAKTMTVPDTELRSLRPRVTVAARPPGGWPSGPMSVSYLRHCPPARVPSAICHAVQEIATVMFDLGDTLVLPDTMIEVMLAPYVER